VFHRYLEHQTDHLPFGLLARLIMIALAIRTVPSVVQTVDAWAGFTRHSFEEAIELNEAQNLTQKSRWPTRQQRNDRFRETDTGRSALAAETGLLAPFQPFANSTRGT
jgi:hypothetical protein